MHLQQTKKGSIKTGGPQYYFHDLKNTPKNIDVIELRTMCDYLKSI